MNLLTQIVPGLRDTRVPLATGALYAIAIWVLLPMLHTEGKTHLFVMDLVQQWDHLPAAVGAAGGMLMLYLGGLLLAFLGAQITELLTALMSSLVLLALLMLPIALLLSSWLVPLAIGVLVVAYHASAWRFSRLPASQYLGFLRSRAYLRIDRWNDFLKGANFLSATRAVVNRSLDDIVDQILSDRRRTETFVGQVSNQALAPCIAGRSEMTSEDLGEEVPPGIGKLTRVYAVLSSNDEESARIRQRYVQRLNETRGARLFFATHCFNRREAFQELERRLLRTEIALRDEKKELFNEVDRLRSEGELRTSVAVPAALVFSLGMLRFLLLGGVRISYLITIPIVLFIVIFITLLWVGRAKAMLAEGMLYDCYKAGRVKLPETQPVLEMINVLPAARDDFDYFRDSSLIFYARRILRKRSGSTKIQLKAPANDSSLRKVGPVESGRSPSALEEDPAIGVFFD